MTKNEIMDIALDCGSNIYKNIPVDDAVIDKFFRVLENEGINKKEVTLDWVFYAIYNASYMDILQYYYTKEELIMIFTYIKNKKNRK